MVEQFDSSGTGIVLLERASLLVHAVVQRLGERRVVEDQLQRRIQSFLQECHRGRGTRTEGSGIALGTGIGAVRKENQDRAIVVEGRYADAPERNFVLAALCDGMGGMAQGEYAAVLALSTFVARILRHGRTPPHERLEQAALIANRVVHSELHGNGGATLTATLVERTGKAAGINVGDSRLYQIANDEVRQLSRDDTLGEYFRSEHGDPPATAHRHEILQFVGIGDGIQPHMLNIDAPTNRSFFLLTSDGAHDVPEETFSRVIVNARSTSEVVDKLLSLADLVGGRDNATVIALPYASLKAPAGPGAHPDVGMTFRFWSPFDELEIWVPALTDPSKEESPPNNERVQGPVLEKEMLYSKLARRKKRPRRRKIKSTDDGADEPEAPRLDIDFPKVE